MNHRARINAENNIIISLLFIIAMVALYFTFNETTLENSTTTQDDITSTTKTTTKNTTNIIKNIISNIQPDIATANKDIKDDTTKEVIEKKDEVITQIPQEQNINQNDNSTIDIEKKLDDKKDNKKDETINNDTKQIKTQEQKEDISPSSSLAPVVVKKVEFKTITEFYNTIKKSIKKKIKNNTSTPTSAKIRLTLFKNGRVDHMKFMGGNQEFYDFNKRRILWVFPVQIPQNLESKFPRYFRMEIKGK